MKLKFTLETSLFLGKTFFFFHNSLIILTVLSGFDTTYLSSFSLSSFVYHCLVFKVQPILNLSYPFLSVRIGGDEENRTPDPLLARQVLSQLSYTPKFNLILRQDFLDILICIVFVIFPCLKLNYLISVFLVCQYLCRFCKLN